MIIVSFLVLQPLPLFAARVKVSYGAWYSFHQLIDSCIRVSTCTDKCYASKEVDV
jgi:hypothetical protein